MTSWRAAWSPKDYTPPVTSAAGSSWAGISGSLWAHRGQPVLGQEAGGVFKRKVEADQPVRHRAAEEMQQDGTDEADECEQRMHGAKAAQGHLLTHVAQDARRPARERVIDPLQGIAGAADDLEEQIAHDPGPPL